MDAKKIGAFIAAARRAHGLTQQQLAERLGVTNRAVSKWETGQGLPDIALLPALAAALDTTTDELLAGAPAQPACAPAPGGADGDVLARLPGRRPTRRELDAALSVCRTLPGQRAARLLLAAAGLAAAGFGVRGALQAFFDGSPTPLPAFVLLALGMLLLAEAALSPLLAARLRRDLGRRAGGTVYADRFCSPAGGQRSLAQLARAQRFPGYTVLVWHAVPVPYAAVVPDDACAVPPQELARCLQNAAPAAYAARPARTPRLPRPALALPLALAALALAALALAPSLGFAGSISPTGTLLRLRRDRETGVVTDMHSGQTFAYPAVGRLKKQWLTGDCCAITYQTTDGTTHVHLAAYGDRGGGGYYYVEPLLQGAWRQYESAAEPGLVLRKEPGREEIFVQNSLLTTDYRQVYTDSVQFGTLGIALCDADGPPRWTVVLGKDYDASDGVDPYGSLILCPVSMEPTEAVTLHYYSPEKQQQDKDAAQPQPTPTPAPAQSAPDAAAFSQPVDCAVRADGVYFTWDGGATCSRAVDGTAGVAGKEDLEPYLQTENAAAFLTVQRVKGTQQVWLHLTRDRGANWQHTPLATWEGVQDVARRSLGFLDDSFGWYALCTGWSMGTGRGAALGTTRDGGVTWQACAIPGESSSRLLSGVVFCDPQTAAATLCDQNEAGWPDVYITRDGGATWQRAAMPWDDETLTDTARRECLAAQDLYSLDHVCALQNADGVWLLTLAAAPDGGREAVFAADDPAGPWTLQRVRDAG